MPMPRQVSGPIETVRSQSDSLLREAAGSVLGYSWLSLPVNLLRVSIMKWTSAKRQKSDPLHSVSAAPQPQIDANK